MRLELTSEQVELLREILEHELRVLGPEIRHTHARAFRDDLRTRYDALCGLIEQLRQPAPISD
jgi:hypothetical protein